MKRENFRIECSNGSFTVKHKWNSALREVEAQVRLIARKEETIYDLVKAVSQKDVEGRNHITGIRVWYGHNGRTLEFKINKVD